MVVKRQNLYLQGSTYRWINLFFISCFLFFSATGAAAQTTIRGTAIGFEGTEITAFSYHNYITYSSKTLATATIQEDGSFQISLPQPHSKLVMLELDFREFRLFVSEGDSYEVNVKQDAVNAAGILFSIEKAPEGDRNKRIDNFEEEYVQLADSLFQYIMTTKGKSIIDSVFHALAEETKKGADAYTRTFVDYNIALITQITHKSKVSQFEKEYLIDKPVKEDNIAYMRFINQYFSNYLSMLAMVSNTNKIPELINKEKNLEGMMEVLALDSKLANDTLRELVLLKGLHEVFNDPVYNEQMVLDMVDSVAAKTKIKSHIVLAKDIKQALLQLRTGSKAPDFNLIDEVGNKVKLGDLEGKYVYINFWATWSLPCIQEMKVMTTLVEKYGEQIVFVNISIDKDYEAMKKFLLDKQLVHPENKFKEYYLHYGGNEKLKTEYQVETIPMHIFIDREGRILKAPAERPSGYIERTFTNTLLNVKTQPTISDPGDD